jgi:hypothetical protein
MLLQKILPKNNVSLSEKCGQDVGSDREFDCVQF